jgi:Domain of unknown function (DUF1772)
MMQTLQVLSVMFAAFTMAQMLAHALEFPGKRRLDRDTYVKVQTIYYPGFTIGGAFEPLSVIATFALLLFTPFGTTSFWLVAIAFVGLTLAHAIYWTVTHPVNKVWVKDVQLGKSGGTFFGAGNTTAAGDWTELRDRWEWSHVARAALAVASLIALVVAAVL